MRQCLLVLLIFFAATSLFGQAGRWSNWRQQELKSFHQSIVGKAEVLIPSTLQLIEVQSGKTIDTAWYVYRQNQLIWRVDTQKITLPLRLYYRVLPRAITQVWRQLDTTKLHESPIAGFSYNPYATTEPLIDFKKLNYSGNFSRGLSLGNRQDLVLNSNFNLQLAGDLGDGVQILAAISDESIPIQPEGNTIQIQELDRVFVQLKKNGNQLTVGDYELNRPEGYFMNYFKKLQGATVLQQQKVGKKGVWYNGGSVAITKGKFARNILEAQEGNQGPYKLRGNNGERFIVILSGTEKVWLNGERLQRGRDFDYTIDYNRGEITFMPKRIIVRESRITLEFEYSDQSYLRTLYTYNSRFETKNFKAYVNFYQEQDSRTSTGGVTIGPNERSLLEKAGDNAIKAAVSSIRKQQDLNPSRALYLLKDTTLACGKLDSVLVFSTDVDRVRYTAQFSFVGAGNGNYILETTITANERVYRWISPDPLTCVPRGDYAPVIQLTSPTQLRMGAAGFQWNMAKNSSWQTEVSLSNVDKNRYSKQDDQDNLGTAVFTQLKHRFLFGADEKAPQINLQLSYEGLQQNFRALNPYRSPEFLRDWTLANFQGIGTVVAASEQLTRAGWQFLAPKVGQVSYLFSSYVREAQFRGFKHELEGKMQQKGFTLSGSGNLIQASTLEENRTFWRPKISIDKVFEHWKKWSIGWAMEAEHNDRRKTVGDSLTTVSYRYYSHRFYLKSPEEKTWQTSWEYLFRQDFKPVNGEYNSFTRAAEMRWNSRLQLKRAININSNLTYRHLDSKIPTTNNLTSGTTLLGRVDFSTVVWKGLLRTSSTYELGSGQEPQLEFTYLKVAKGQGNYIWLDSLYNRDGIIQPNEMEISPFPDIADFIRVATVTDKYIRTNFTNLNQSVNIDPRAKWFNAETGIKKILKFLSIQSSLRINRKTQDRNQSSAWNPFVLNLNDPNLVAVTSTGRHSFFINRANPTWELQWGSNDNRSKMIQTTGFESRFLQEYFFQLRWNLTKTWSFKSTLSSGHRSAISEAFNNKNYRLAFQKWEPQLTWQPRQYFRVNINYRYQADRNVLTEGAEKDQQNELGAELTYTPAGNTAIRSKFSWIGIDFTGKPASPVGFAILNGLQPGRNLLWNISVDRQIARNLQLRFSYEGRQTGANRIVHVGRMQVSALF